MPNIEKVSFINITSTSGKYGSVSSTFRFKGYIAGMYYSTDGTDPLNTSSSSIVRIREGNTSGNVLARSSSGFDPGAAQWFHIARKVVDQSTFSGTPSSQFNARTPIGDEKLVVTIQNKSTAAGKGSTEKFNLDIYVEGARM